ncbi:phosphatase 2C-like protein 44 [Senna tora]|uniref:Phosphatase 2C-like protein 44 n=1 Tax=Senna tora TaxID=362788 RepID=A0A834SMF7_9FABA|nr:phosphatase 2C-like protein 44 [Senna tora]
MVPVSHGCHVIGHRVIKGGSDLDSDSDSDSVVVQREQMENAELWYFGIFDSLIGDGVTKYMQSHFFQKQLKESHVSKKCKETLKKAYLNARAKMREQEKSDERCSNRMSSASVIVVNGEKLVMANMGNYRAVVCRDGIAYDKNGRHQQSAKRHYWTRRLFSVRILACDSGAATRHSKSSELVVAAERIDSDTEFLILASHGIWEVMKNQEAVNLIRHIEDPQEAAECLAKEALIRMSRSNISCIIIRFD